MTRRFDPDLIPPFPTLDFEKGYWQQGFNLVAGLDEAGRGALAGPLCAAAVILPPDHPALEQDLYGVRDSKQMSHFDHEQWAPVIQKIVLDYAVAWVEPDEIDRLGMARAGKLVFKRAIEGLKNQPQHLLVDYFNLPEVDIEQTCLVKGDQRSLSIACASVIAKRTRDQRMLELGQLYPGYNFEQNKGYGSPDHLQAIRELGLCPIHRRSFSEHLLQGRLFDLD